MSKPHDDTDSARAHDRGDDAAPPDRDATLATFRRRRGDELRVTWGAYRGRDRLDVRLWLLDENGRLVPTRQGTTFRPDELTDLATAIAGARAAADVATVPASTIRRPHRPRGGARVDPLEADALVTLVGEMVDAAPDRTWRGTATELLAGLDTLATEATRCTRAWPGSAAALTSRLRRLDPTLRARGVEVDRDARTGSTRVLSLRRVRKVEASSSPSSIATSSSSSSRATDPA
ncbi:MAG: PC4/YdbC family ssDNA-binding protein [Polyangiales bacterium]